MTAIIRSFDTTDSTVTVASVIDKITHDQAITTGDNDKFFVIHTGGSKALMVRVLQP